MGDVPNDVKDLDTTKALALELDKPFVKDKKKRSHKPTFSKSQQDALIGEIMQEVTKKWFKKLPTKWHLIVLHWQRGDFPRKMPKPRWN